LQPWCQHEAPSIKPQLLATCLILETSRQLLLLRAAQRIKAGPHRLFSRVSRAAAAGASLCQVIVYQLAQISEQPTGRSALDYSSRRAKLSQADSAAG
jgi:hypothetical protein